MSLARSASGPGGLSINTGAANSLSRPGRSITTSQPAATAGLFGSTSTPANNASTTTGGMATTGGLFGSAQPKSGGLFGSVTPAATTTAGGGLFGGGAAATTTAAGSGGLFGAAGTQQQAGGGLFGSSTQQQAQPQQAQQSATGGGLFGQSTQTQQPSTGGGLFGSSTMNQPQQNTGSGLFGQAQQQPQQQTGGLFGQPQQQQQQTGGGLFGQAQQQPQQQTGGLFGQSQQQQPQQQTGGLFGQSQAKPSGGLFGQTNPVQAQSQGPVPAVQINYDNLRPRSRFDDLAKPVQDEIALIDKGIQRVIKMKDEIGEFMPQHEKDIEQLGRDVKFVESKFRAVQVALNRDIQTVKVLQDMTKKNIADGQLSFKAMDNLRLPAHYQQPSLFAGSQSANNAIAGNASSTHANAQDLITYFNRICDDIEKYKRRLDEYRGEIERDMPGVENGLYEQLQSLSDRSSGNVAIQDQLGQVLLVLRETGATIVAQAGRIADTRERLAKLQAGLVDSGVYALGTAAYA
ncbi:hypothetical protein S40285_05043 [Stachybotrys chlorohalonatus IBT 40285]|uniref:Nucleoporin Nup54 alpha-helical domain-containing protein n=1 Tax=Stachybotrys chlorohalonatus (strain IBT 40285) TaxID=1283841 RepID=A0A084QFK1_STAC4|nr:hypothetical protein S40285_05043 [Stachybotrys chlorohalonata IBT 40285]